jgi:UDP-N-acetylmuramyl tripeptide synthase
MGKLLTAVHGSRGNNGTTGTTAHLVSLLAEEAGLAYTDGNMFTLSIRKEYFQCPSQFPVAVF